MQLVLLFTECFKNNQNVSNQKLTLLFRFKMYKNLKYICGNLKKKNSKIKNEYLLTTI